REQLFENTKKAILGARALQLPLLCTEQVPDKLGPTVPELAEHLGDVQPIAKRAFSCAGDAGFNAALEATGRRQVLLCGIETHICVYQTARDLIGRSYQVHLLADAVSSRNATNRAVALETMRSLGARLTTVEMALFEMLGVAEGEVFRQVSRIVK
ncbi:MAG: isochorismatase family protein, partial [Myxococcales bacterium]|nr:isochorismatase family protein [Myxococcales bacterium]